VARVYVSSTFEDLQRCRAEVRRALQRLDQVDVAMETQVADDGRPLDRCLAGVAGCDLYLGIFAWRYGHVPAGQDLSITELEYREALRLGKPVLVFLLSEDAPWPRTLMDVGEDAGRIERLRADLRERHQCSWFRDPSSLACEVIAAVARWLAASTRAAGSGRPAPAYVPVLGRIAAGGPILAEQAIEDVFPLPREVVGKGTLFLLRVVGESMIGAAICDGDWVVVRRQPVADHGDVVAAMIDDIEDEATVKTLRRSGGRVWLHPENPAFPDIPADHATILGRIVAVLRRV
jgi:repressor LexA